MVGGPPQHEELYGMVVILGRLRTTLLTSLSCGFISNNIASKGTQV